MLIDDLNLLPLIDSNEYKIVAYNPGDKIYNKDNGTTLYNSKNKLKFFIKNNIDDITIRQLLNIKKMILVKKKYQFLCDNCNLTHFYQNDDYICISFIIYNREKFVLFPILGMKDIYQKKNINNSFKHSIVFKNIRIKKKIYAFLSLKKKFSIDFYIIGNVLSYI